MPKQSKTAASGVPTMAVIQKATLKEAALSFVDQTVAAGRAFMTCCKLGLRIESELKAGETLGTKIIKLANVPANLRRRVKSTVDNARQAMRVWKELVEPGHITEAVFDGFTFGDCLSINRVMSGASKAKLNGEEIATVIAEGAENWHEEIDCQFHYGQTLSDRAAAEQQTPTPAASTTSETASSDAAAETAAAEHEEGETSPATAPPAANSEPEPGKVVQMPPQTKPTIDEATKLLNALCAIVSELPAEDQLKIAVALEETAAVIREEAAPAPAKKTAVKRKVAKGKKQKAA